MANTEWMDVLIILAHRVTWYSNDLYSHSSQDTTDGFLFVKKKVATFTTGRLYPGIRLFCRLEFFPFEPQSEMQLDILSFGSQFLQSSCRWDKDYIEILCFRWKESPCFLFENRAHVEIRHFCRKDSNCSFLGNWTHVEIRRFCRKHSLLLCQSEMYYLHPLHYLLFNW